MSISLLLAAAQAGSYTTELVVPSIHDPSLTAASLDGGGRALHHAAGMPDTVVQSDHPLIYCEVKNEILFVQMRANRNDYPSSFPFNGTCKYGGDDLQVTVVPYAPAADPSLQPNHLDGNLAVSFTRVQGTRWRRAYELPDCPDPYVPGKKVAAAGVSNVYCETLIVDGEPHVFVDILANATMGTGVCSLPLDSGGTTDITLHLAETATF